MLMSSVPVMATEKEELIPNMNIQHDSRIASIIQSAEIEARTISLCEICGGPGKQVCNKEKFYDSTVYYHANCAYHVWWSTTRFVGDECLHSYNGLKAHSCFESHTSLSCGTPSQYNSCPYR